MYLTQKEQKDLVVKKARNGKGVFALRQFVSGQIVAQIIGKRMTCDIDDDIDEETRSNTFRLDADWYISPKNRIGHYINHSCEPNIKVVKKDDKLFVVAMAPIQKGEEIVFDYSTIIARDDIWTMKCDCGSEKCRGVVKQFQKLPKKIREKYRREAIVPNYILNI